MAKVITLDGLESRHLNSDCDEVVEVSSTVLKRTYTVCKKDLERIAQKGEPIRLPGEGGQIIVEPSRLLPEAPKRLRGRPKGTTVRAGAKQPSVKPCMKVKLVTTRRGKVCKCADPNNAQILPLRRCRD